MGKYQVDLTLCRLSAIAISKHLWMHSMLKEHLESYIDGIHTCDIMADNVSGVMDGLILPVAAKEELRFTVGTMGVEIRNFFVGIDRKDFQGMTVEGPLFIYTASTCMDNVRWTPDGCIDQSETMRSLYFEGKLQENYATWEVLCIHCLEDCINDLWPKIGTMDEFDEWRNRQPTHRFIGVLFYWAARVTNEMENLMNYVLLDESYDDAYSLEENMFINSFVCGEDSAVKYFWGSFNESQRMRTIAKICENIMSDDPTLHKYKDLFFSQRALTGHLLMFFLQQLSYYGLDNVRIKILGSGFMLTLLLEWPYDNLFMKTLRESWIHHDSIDYLPIIDRICLNVSRCKLYNFIACDVKYRGIFDRIWHLNPEDLKSSIDYEYVLMVMCKSNCPLGDKELRNRRRKEFLNLMFGF